MTPEQKRRWIRVVLFVAIIGLFLLFYFLRGVLWPFVFAFLIAYIIDPWVEFIARSGLPRLAAICIVLAGLLLLFAVFSVLIFPRIGQETSHAAEKFPHYMEVVKNKMGPWLKDLSDRYPEEAAQVEQYFNQTLRPKLPLLLAPIWDSLRYMFSGVVNFIVMMLNLLLVPVLTFYLLKDFPRIREASVELLPPRHREKIEHWAREANDALSQYLRGQLSVSLALGLIYTAGLLILGVPLAIPVGLLSGLANMVPYLGFILGIGASLLLSFVDNQDWHRLIWIVLLYAFAQLMEGTWMGPLLVGRRTGLHPVVIMLALVIGGTLFGFMGMLLAVPFMAVASVFLKASYETYLKSDWYHKR